MLIVDTHAERQYRLLDTVNSPADLRDLSVAEMEQLARELRETIITTVARTGGHLAPSLGVVAQATVHDRATLDARLKAVVEAQVRSMLPSGS